MDIDGNFKYKQARRQRLDKHYKDKKGANVFPL